MVNRFLVVTFRGRYLLDNLDDLERSLRKADPSAAADVRRFAVAAEVGDVLSMKYGFFVRVRVSEEQREAMRDMWNVDEWEQDPS
jgi:hypothetical protein